MSESEPSNSACYYDALLKIIDNDILPDLTTPRAKYSGNFLRKEIARWAALNAHRPALPESLASLHSDAVTTATLPKDKKALYRAVLEEGRLMDAIEDATMERLKPRAPSPETSAALPDSINAATTQAYLRAHLDPKLVVNDLRVLSGGRSKQTILLSLTGGDGKPLERVIRRDMATSPTGATVPDEFELLKVLHSKGYPVPLPYHCERDSNKLGPTPFNIVGKISGTLDGHLFDPPSKAAVLDSARALGKLHTLPVADIQPTLRPQFREAPDAAKRRELILELRATWDEERRVPTATVEFAFDWMLENVDSLKPLVAVVHGDYSYHNILFDGDKVSAVLDWELVRLGHPAEDVGFIRPAALKRVTWAEFMAAYRAGGGPDIDSRDQLYYSLLEKLRLMIMLFKVRPYVEKGYSDDIEFVDAILMAIPRIVQQMAYELRVYPGLGALAT